jgi:hypothetical protein
MRSQRHWSGGVSHKSARQDYNWPLNGPPYGRLSYLVLAGELRHGLTSGIPLGNPLALTDIKCSLGADARQGLS